MMSRANFRKSTCFIDAAGASSHHMCTCALSVKHLFLYLCSCCKKYNVQCAVHIEYNIYVYVFKCNFISNFTLLNII